MKLLKSVLFGMLMMLTLAACGGTISGDYAEWNIAGEYTGSYKTNLITADTPFYLTLKQAGTTLTGQFSSVKISGTVTGRIANTDKSFTVTVTEPYGAGSVVVSFSQAGNHWTILSVTGTDVFGAHTSGSGTLAVATGVTSPFANGYNGYGNFVNNTNASDQVIATVSGTYPISMTSLLPDGSGKGWSGVMNNIFMSGMMNIIYNPVMSMYDGNIVKTGSAYPWGMGPGNFVTDLADPTGGFMYFWRSDPSLNVYIDSNSVVLHPGDITKTLPGVWTYTNPSTTAAGVVSMTLTVTSVDGVHYVGQVSAIIRQSDGSAVVDLVSGTLSGAYDMTPHTNPHITPERVFQIKMSSSSALNITNPSGLTSDLVVYLNYVDNSTSPMQSVVNVDSGNRAWGDITLTK